MEGRNWYRPGQHRDSAAGGRPMEAGLGGFYALPRDASRPSVCWAEKRDRGYPIHVCACLLICLYVFVKCGGWSVGAPSNGETEQTKNVTGSK